MYKDQVWIDATPVDEAEPYGAFKGHSRGHDAYWVTLQRAGSVPRDIEYDEVPRGRVGYDVNTRTYHLYLDNCILDDRAMVDEIVRLLNLPVENTIVGRDAHYRCPDCIRGNKTPEQLRREEQDWDF